MPMGFSSLAVFVPTLGRAVVYPGSLLCWHGAFAVTSNPMLARDGKQHVGQPQAASS